MRNTYSYNDPIDYSHFTDPEPKTPLDRIYNHVLEVRRSLYDTRRTLEELEAELNSALDEIDNLIAKEEIE